MRSLFNTETGELTGFRSDAEGALLLANTPPGHSWADGELDPRRCTVRELVDDFGELRQVIAPRTPPRPADTENQVWSWDAEADDWVAGPSLALRKALASEPVLARFPALDAAVARPVGEIAEATALGLQPPQEAVQRLQAIHADKQALRDRLAAIAATETAEQLTELLASWEPEPAG